MSRREVDYEVKVAAWATEVHATINWQAVHDLDRMINWELWHGPLPSDYWTVAEPSVTPWPGFEAACAQLTELLAPLPHEVWVDGDSDCVTDSDPELFAPYWGPRIDHHLSGVSYCNSCRTKLILMDDDEHECESPDEWIGGDMWMQLDVRKAILHVETWKQVF